MGLSCFSKNSNTEISDAPIFFPYDFAVVWDHIHSYPDYVSTSPEKQREFLKFALDVVKLDLQGYTISKMFYQEDARMNPRIFPAAGICPPIEKKEISFEGKTVLTMPYSGKKLINAIMDINRKGFQKQKDSSGIYFQDINLLILQNGQHHSAVASIRGGGSVIAEVYNLSDAFEHLTISEDYKYWIIDGRQKIDIEDPRFALLYELTKEIENLI